MFCLSVLSKKENLTETLIKKFINLKTEYKYNNFI